MRVGPMCVGAQASAPAPACLELRRHCAIVEREKATRKADVAAVSPHVAYDCCCA